MFVVGRVLDPDGKPVPGATVAVYARSLAPKRTPGFQMPLPIGDARTDGSGRFRIDAPRTSSAQYRNCGVVALAPGFGAGWVELDPDDERPTAEIALRPEQVIQGRLFDLQGRPAAGVTVSVESIARNLPWARTGPRRPFEGVFYGGTTINGYPAWPRPAISDADGRFTVRGVGKGLRASLSVHHPQFALESIDVVTDDASKTKSVTAALPPAQIINVRVTYADTGAPAPHAPLQVRASRVRAGFGRVLSLDDSETGADGRARATSWATDQLYTISAYPPEGQPYLPAHGRIDWPKGALEQSLDLALPRGVLIRGKVTEEGSGKPVAGATVIFVDRAVRQDFESYSPIVSTASDGSFRMGAKTGPGILFVRGPSDDYVLEAIGSRMLREGQPGGSRVYTHAHTALDLKPESDPQDVHLVLRRVAEVKGRVVGPDGQPVRQARIISRIFLERPGPWQSWRGRRQGNVRDGRFELHGLAPNAEVPVIFLEPKGKLGVAVNLSGKSAASGPVTVRLEPCGAARGRVVDPGGKPVAGTLRDLAVMMVVTPGPTRSLLANDKSGLLAADEDDLARVDPVNYEKDPAPDADGRIALPVLIPGATYRVIDYTAAVRGQAGPAVRKEFTVKPGETLDLGDIRIERPPR
jgi:protocatechuate 3,4-dioxygenase beta subunit